MAGFDGFTEYYGKVIHRFRSGVQRRVKELYKNFITDFLSKVFFTYFWNKFYST